MTPDEVMGVIVREDEGELVLLLPEIPVARAATEWLVAGNSLEGEDPALDQMVQKAAMLLDAEGRAR